jgi:hypothetical protein
VTLTEIDDSIAGIIESNCDLLDCLREETTPEATVAQNSYRHCLALRIASDKLG